MNYYIVPSIGDGSEETPFRPDIPSGTSFVGNRSDDGTFIISTPEPLEQTLQPTQPTRPTGDPLPTDPLPTELSPLNNADLQNECWFRGIGIDDIKTWFVG